MKPRTLLGVLRGMRANYSSFRPTTGGNCRRSMSSDASVERIKKFYDPEVQTLLKGMTDRDLEKVFRNRKFGQKLAPPTLSFMTAELLEATIDETRKEAEDLLQMPPVLPARKPIDKILSFDPALQGYDNSTFIMTDITMNVKERDRIIVARDPDGTLRQASWEERTQMNRAFFPVPGQEFSTPKMFSDTSTLQSVLDRASPEDNTYEFVLDRACIQFEPDDPLYISVLEVTYDEIDQKRHYDYIRSTRHFGPFVFYLVRNRKMDSLLIYNLQKERIQDGTAPMITLFHLLFPECKSKPEFGAVVSDAELLRRYIEFDAVKKSELELANNAYEETVSHRQQIEDGLHKAHGVN